MSPAESREILPTSVPVAERGIQRQRADLLTVVVLTLCSAALSAHFNLSEWMIAWLRRHEALQIDELPGVVVVMTCSLLWFSARRYGDLVHMLRAHERAETQLANQLERNRTLHRELLDVQESERQQVARELHDELGQYLGILRLDLHGLASLPAEAGALEREALFARAQGTLNRVQATIRDLIRRLRPAALDALGLAAALDDLVSSWRQRLPDTRFSLNAPEGAADIASDSAIAAFRIVQEALTNVARHSRAGLVEITVTTVQQEASPTRWLQLVIADDGIGFVTGQTPPGFGIRGIRERVEALGGAVDWDSRPGDGCVLHARFPLDAAILPRDNAHA